jgi:predicted secreted protein
MAIVELTPRAGSVSARPGDHLVLRIGQQGGTGFMWKVDPRSLPPGARIVRDEPTDDRTERGTVAPGGCLPWIIEIELGAAGGRLSWVKQREWGEHETLERFDTDVVVSPG